MPPRSAAPWSWTVLAILLALLAQGVAVFNPDFVVVDCEERFNAAHGVALAQGHWDALFALQYRKFCGGCTFDAALAGVLFGLLPASFGVWKLVPLLFTAGIAGVGFRGMWQLSGPRAAAIFVGLLLLAPGAWIRLALLGWGNHYEAGLFCLALALCAARPPSDRAHLGVGLLAGFALWFGFSSTYAVVGLVGWLLWRRRFGALAFFGAGTLLAPVLWSVQYLTTHQHPFGTIYVDGEAVPMASRIPEKFSTLVHPKQLAGLFGIPRLSLGIPLGVGAFASLAAASGAAVRGIWHRETRQRPGSIFFAILSVWVLLYLVVEFRLELREDERTASAAGLRYAAPWFPLMWAFLAVTAGRWWREGRRLQTGLLLLPFVLTGLLTKAAVLGGPFPNDYVFRLEAPDHENYRFVHSYALDPREHDQCTGTDDDHRAAHAYAAGRHAALGILGGDEDLTGLPPPVEPTDDFYAGVGQALVDHLDSDAHGGLSVLEEVADALRVLPDSARLPALAEATWWRAYRDAPHGFARGAAGSATALKRLLQASTTVDPDLRDEALQSLGRRWGMVQARWGLVGTVRVPAARIRKNEQAGLRAFAWGYGYGLATKWGPQQQVPRPEGMPTELDALYLSGVEQGIALQWAERATPTISATAPDGGAWQDVGADRWWGHVPTMFCPCRATCW